MDPQTMTQEQRRLWLLDALLAERPEYQNIGIPQDEPGQQRLLRALFNVRAPQPVSEDFLKIQDAYLQDLTAEKGVVDVEDLAPVQPDLYLWQGDITTLRCGAIVNAANSGMTGCYVPNHKCIDNCIHTFAGIQLRNTCAGLMRTQGHEEPTGKAKITPAYNLPCDYVLHTVGPIITGRVRKQDEQLLASCYRSCLELADEHGVQSVAFCCISTGEFHFPNDLAAQIAVHTVQEYKMQTGSTIKVIFNVFKDIDLQLYQALLG